ncbi:MULTISPECIES: hypothetical protein [unclassified Flavobacterium]|uniref:hypothetical protein n=1 Tax=unclassified Flavobacterium TaxID=196869 RepID=UPI001F13EBB4|nr:MULTISPECIES: hypothetical protein [unclassified Flavobacterium]UMY64541.1 hypothetical protein MKO97_08455 [Flavobacterium sp. HJ-32-4]
MHTIKVFIAILDFNNKAVMKTNKSTSTVSKVIAASASTKKRIAAVADNLKGKELFSDKVELARRTLSDVKSLPI